MRAQLQYRLPQTPELLTICLAIVSVSFSPSSPPPPLSCFTLPLFVMDTKMQGNIGAGGAGISCRGARHLPGTRWRRLRGCPAPGREKRRRLGAPPMALEKN